MSVSVIENPTLETINATARKAVESWSRASNAQGKGDMLATQALVDAHFSNGEHPVCSAVDLGHVAALQEPREKRIALDDILLLVFGFDEEDILTKKQSKEVKVSKERLRRVLPAVASIIYHTEQSGGEKCYSKSEKTGALLVEARLLGEKDEDKQCNLVPVTGGARESIAHLSKEAVKQVPALASARATRAAHHNDKAVTLVHGKATRLELLETIERLYNGLDANELPVAERAALQNCVLALTGSLAPTVEEACEKVKGIWTEAA